MQCGVCVPAALQMCVRCWNRQMVQSLTPLEMLDLTPAKVVWLQEPLGNSSQWLRRHWKPLAPFGAIGAIGAIGLAPLDWVAPLAPLDWSHWTAGAIEPQSSGNCRQEMFYRPGAIGHLLAPLAPLDWRHWRHWRHSMAPIILNGSWSHTTLPQRNQLYGNEWWHAMRDPFAIHRYM